MKHLWFFHEMLNLPYEMYHESQFMVYDGLFHGPLNAFPDQIIIVLSWRCRDFMGAVPMKC